MNFQGQSFAQWRNQASFPSDGSSLVIKSAILPHDAPLSNLDASLRRDVR
jgi:hypothetical protein